MEDFRTGQQCECTGDIAQAINFYSKAYTTFRIIPISDRDPFIFYEITRAYAYSLDNTTQIQLQEDLYIELSGLNENGPHIGDYAIFLHKRKTDYTRANIYYLKAISLFPNHSTFIFKYAGFLRYIKKDNILAESYYNKAIQANPLNSDAVGGYASFLHGVKHDYDACEEYYKKAIELDDSHVNNLCNYCLFLSEQKSNYHLAEQYFHKIFAISPGHCNSLYNYAVMLDTHCNKKDDAENLYRKVLNLNPSHSYSMYNLAQLLENKLKLNSTLNIKDKSALVDEIISFYNALIKLDAQDSIVHSDFGRFILLHTDRQMMAEKHLNKALQIDNCNEVALYYLGYFYYNHSKDESKCEKLLRRLLGINDNHVAALRLLAELLVSYRSGSSANSNILELLEKAASACSSTLDLSSILNTYVNFIIKIKIMNEKRRGIHFLHEFQKTSKVRLIDQDDSAELHKEIINYISLLNSAVASL